MPWDLGEKPREQVGTGGFKERREGKERGYYEEEDQEGGDDDVTGEYLSGSASPVRPSGGSWHFILKLESGCDQKR